MLCVLNPLNGLAMVYVAIEMFVQHVYQGCDLSLMTRSVAYASKNAQLCL